MRVLGSKLALLALALALPLGATQIFVTAGNASTSGGPVDAEAIFSASAGQLTITLIDLEANPTNVAQLLSDLEFTTVLTGTATLSSSSGTEIWVNGDGSTTLGSSVSTGWVLNTSGNTYTLDVLGTSTAPSHLIIGPPDGTGVYSNANGSIAGAPSHNPFLNQSATFTITNSSITADTTVANVIFSFGTTAGITVPGIPSQGEGFGVPEPSSLALVGLGALATFLGLRKRRA